MYRIDSNKFEKLVQDHKNKFLWAILPIARILVQMEELYSSVHITKAGFSTLKNVQKIKDNDQIKSLLKNFKEDEVLNRNLEFAAKEIKREFQILNRNVVINLWTYLEYAIKELIFELLKNDTQFLEIEQIKKIKIPFGIFSKMDEEERLYYLIDEFERQIVANIPYGPKRLVLLLEPFGLRFEVSKEIQYNIFELAQVRNLILHKNCIVDPFFKKKCPQFNIDIGKKMKITDEMIDRYSNSIAGFSIPLIEELAAYVEKKFPDQVPEEFRDAIKSSGEGYGST